VACSVLSFGLLATRSDSLLVFFCSLRLLVKLLSFGTCGTAHGSVCVPTQFLNSRWLACGKATVLYLRIRLPTDRQFPNGCFGSDSRPTDIFQMGALILELIFAIILESRYLLSTFSSVSV
jgi:hypothetical protein